MYKNFHLEESSSKMNIFKNKLLYIFRAERNRTNVLNIVVTSDFIVNFCFDKTRD
jgi:hypothetical protein